MKENPNACRKRKNNALWVASSIRIDVCLVGLPYCGSSCAVQYFLCYCDFTFNVLEKLSKPTKEYAATTGKQPCCSCQFLLKKITVL